MSSGEQLSFEGFQPSELERIEARRILKNGLTELLGIGPAKAKSTKALAQRLFTTDRAVTLAVYDARRAGIPICSGQDGFFLPGCESDVIECWNGLRGRAAEINDSADAILAGWYAGWRSSTGGGDL